MKCTPSQNKSKFLGQFLRGGIFRRSLRVTTKKKGRQLFWQKKCTPRQNPGYACHQIGASINQKTSSPWAMKLSWQHIYIAFSMMTYKPSKVGHNDLVFGL